MEIYSNSSNSFSSLTDKKIVNEVIFLAGNYFQKLVQVIKSGDTLPWSRGVRNGSVIKAIGFIEYNSSSPPFVCLFVLIIPNVEI